MQWAELGGHGGERLEDIQLAAGVLAGRRVHPEVRFNIVPCSREVFAEAGRPGAGAARGRGDLVPAQHRLQPGLQHGRAGPDEAMISTHARNFPGRNGSPDAAMYLASAATVAAAVAGTITDPREVAK